MGGTESKTDTSSKKTEVNTSLIQFHWESYGWGAASIILCILLVGMIMILIYFLKLWCCKTNFPRRQECGFDPYIPLGTMRASMSALPVYQPNMMEIRAQDPQQQLAITTAMDRLHTDRVARLQSLP